MIEDRRFDWMYPVPRRFDTLEQDERHAHGDLGRMTRPELLRERDRLRMRLLFDDAPSAWLLERLARIEEALRDAR